MIVPTTVRNIAATWLCVIVDESRPMPVEQQANARVARSSVGKLPLMGTPNAVTASRHIVPKLTIASAT